MELNAVSLQLKAMPMFSGQKETFSPWQLKLIVNVREKGIQEALLPIPDALGAARTAAYFKADNSLYNTIITSLSGDALLFATQRFSVKEDTSIDAYLGHQLYQAMKKKYAGGLTPQLGARDLFAGNEDSQHQMRQECIVFSAIYSNPLLCFHHQNSN